MPLASATVVPKAVVPSKTVTEPFARAVPTMVGVNTLVMPSVFEMPESVAGVRPVITGDSGVAVTITKDLLALATLALPALSLAVAVIE